ncbi:hypothetical protein DPEC_G00239890 [Dallia pectoralis]|uniref:Uncharacterized protein n=1 Tax=Dallia pectoralis TaxID=75939 RepID=A0ACC2FZI1_DALPE|nr:hypothetical protein DPEC_G00239890 [Dallia pectoralis]
METGKQTHNEVGRMAAKHEESVDENVLIPDDSEDDYQYEEVLADEAYSMSGEDEYLEATVRPLGEPSHERGTVLQKLTSAKQPNSHIPEVVDDFLRNFLVKMGMSRTLDCFQAEWYEMVHRGVLKPELVEFVPDAYTHNQLLDNELKNVQRERDSFRQAALQAADTQIKLQKERNFHRMQHKRVVQEKNRLVEDIKRLKKHYESYEPALKQLSDKYQVALKQKMLISLERDRASGQANSLEATLHSTKLPPQISSANRDTGPPLEREKTQSKSGKGVRLLNDGVALSDLDKDPTKSTAQKHPKDSAFPVSSRLNPYLGQIKALGTKSKKTSGFHLTNSLKGHTQPISCLALHPSNFIVASSSDDQLWRLWGMPAGEMIMTGEGHSDWLSGCSFHPTGGMLATTSGDTTVRIWDFSQGRCILTLEGHTHATWGSSFHSCGDFVASCSMDNTTKVWDLESERCRNTLRGHADSVNSVTFLPFSNTLLTCSADKTLSLWDARIGLCSQTYYGHQHSCNYAMFNALGNTIASCDSYGVVKLWDVRKVAAMVTKNTGPDPSNQVAFSPSGRTLAIASNDGSVKLMELATTQVSSLLGHEDAVQSVIFDHNGEYILSAASDGSIILWS